MGRVTVFSIDDCPFCRKAKALLTENGISYYEINLDDYPTKRGDMVKLASSLTVPQVFLNDEHLGGATQVSDLFASGEFGKRWAAAKDAPEPTAPELQRPENTPPAARPKASERQEEALEAGGKRLTLVEAVPALEAALGGATFVSGADMAAAVGKTFGGAPEGAAKEAAARLFDMGAIVGKSAQCQAFSADGGERFALLKATRPLALNNFRKWKDREDAPMVVVKALKKQLGRVLAAHTRDADGQVDYLAASQDPAFHAFDEATCELQRFKLADLDVKTRKAYVINVYNLLTKHAFTKAGLPMSNLQRMDFFDYVGYDLGGGQFFSFNALENGVLRGNKKPPFHLSRTIPRGDERLAAVIHDVDPRIHTALNCGAKSCPPIKSFDADAVEEQLDVVAAAFFEDEANCKVDVATNTITLSKILSWYGSDFAKTKVDVARKVHTWLKSDKAAQAKVVLDSAKPNVGFAHYDWTTDASRALPFKKASVCTIM